MLADSSHEPAAMRSRWMSVLAKSSVDDLDAMWTGSDRDIAVVWLRKPQVGLVMVRGRAGATGNPFNLGEMTVTRCSLRYENGIVGHGYVQGRNRRQAELAARLDALLQQPNRQSELLATVIEPLHQRQVARRMERSRKAASTKIEFFTMVRGENA
ncbi:phosphonate C-P lyase system protein PhnG [Mesorhizobium delmotii]|uniref:Alpha-D-ribose 1-methylphosphonate 5-triphosphate synthase subunit PhnG n=1 Tax=Mesorhizobium delmotii TaxID=1631247 RepID=A0A2P9AMZ3_9HYPH|nr:phosphonate C-P lyase system protein PhnG [Mesorhizobium delmotii]SJM32519.1 Alpha-D-ribose 1-methylphosphonate 5-triphosphate synthase subunit PhnG [Mesorhizobium delmotii]